MGHWCKWSKVNSNAYCCCLFEILAHSYWPILISKSPTILVFLECLFVILLWHPDMLAFSTVPDGLGAPNAHVPEPRHNLYRVRGARGYGLDYSLLLLLCIDARRRVARGSLSRPAARPRALFELPSEMAAFPPNRSWPPFFSRGFVAVTNKPLVDWCGCPVGRQKKYAFDGCVPGCFICRWANREFVHLCAV